MQDELTMPTVEEREIEVRLHDETGPRGRPRILRRRIAARCAGAWAYHLDIDGEENSLRFFTHVESGQHLFAVDGEGDAEFLLRIMAELQGRTRPSKHPVTGVEMFELIAEDRRAFLLALVANAPDVVIYRREKQEWVTIRAFAESVGVPLQEETAQEGDHNG